MKLIKNEEIEFKLFWQNEEVIKKHFQDYIALKNSQGEEKLIRYIKFWGLNINRLELDYLLNYVRILFHHPKPLTFDEALRHSGKSQQFVYATKLMHTFDETKPPVDTFVEKYLDVTRGKDLVAYYQQFCEEFQLLLEKYTRELQSTREKLIKMGLEMNLISDAKLLDSVIWIIQKGINKKSDIK